MNPNLEVLREEIPEAARKLELVVFRGIRTGDERPAVEWDTRREPGYEGFLESAAALGVKAIVFRDQEFQDFMVEGALEEGGDTQQILPSLILSPIVPLFAQIMFFGALLSAIKSCASATLLAPSVSFSENILKPFFPHMSDRNFLRLNRLVLFVFTAMVTESGSTRTISWKLTFSGLSGKAVGAHIHKGKAGVAGAVIVPLCGPCRSGQTGKLKVSKNTADVLERGGAYVNVHTAKNAAGEIRGQIKLVNHVSATTPTPQPGTTTTTPDPGYGGPPPGY